MSTYFGRILTTSQKVRKTVIAKNGVTKQSFVMKNPAAETAGYLNVRKSFFIFAR